MSNRFGRNDARDDLFSSYNRSASPSKMKQKPTHTAPSPYGSYGYGAGSSSSSGGGNGNLYPGGSSDASFRPATPNARGQYSAAVLDELESQNDGEMVGVLSNKVKQLKDLTHLIGDEIRDSTAFAEKMNDQFENSRNRLRGTMARMLRMAEKTGVGWRVWVGFFVAVGVLFWWVWIRG